MVVQGLDHLEALVPTLAGASDRLHARRCMMKQRPLPHQFKASRARTDRGTLDGLLRQTQALSRGAAAIRPFTSDSSSSPDARDQHANPRLSRTCKNSSGRRWKGGPPQDSSSNWDWRDQSFRPCSSRTGSNSCGTPGRSPCLRPRPP